MENLLSIPDREYKVLCKCYTYNQSPYIKETLNGFVMQQTDFPFVCLIVDDCSTDGEQDVIKAFISCQCDVEEAEYYEDDTTRVIYAQHKTNKNCYIAAYLLKENLYKQKKRKLAFVTPWRERCKYEAMCEGDDYWTNPHKIQIQVTFLDNNLGCAMCYTQCRRFDEATESFESNLWGGCNEKFEQFTMGNSVPTLTTVVRIDYMMDYYDTVDPISHNWKMGDYPMWLYLSHKYSIKFIDQNTGVYRITKNSASHFSNPEKYKEFINSSIDIVGYFWNLFKVEGDWSDYLRQRYSRLATNLMFLYNDRVGALSVLSSIEKKTYKEYIKYSMIKYSPFFSLYRRILKK